jgi:hypothetical protein
MTLLSRLREKQAAKIATATLATSATQVAREMRTVESVATVGVAKSPQGQTALSAKVGADDTATASRWWFVHYLDRDPVQVACCPAAIHAEIMEWHPGAVAAEPCTPITRQTHALLSPNEEAAIRAWLVLIGETDLAAIADVMRQCQQDLEAREYFTERAAEVPGWNPPSGRLNDG